RVRLNQPRIRDIPVPAQPPDAPRNPSDIQPALEPMTHLQLRQSLIFGAAALAWLIAGAIAPAGAAEPPTFERDVRPILKTYCLDCHGGGEKLSGNLDLRLRRFAVKGGDTGAAIVPGNAAGSVMIERLKAGEM